MGTLALDNCTLSANLAAGGSGARAAGSDGNGGGLYNLGVATLNNCTFASNSCTGGNGGVFNGTGRSGGSASGGSIYNGGTATLNNCTLSGNAITQGQPGSSSAPPGNGSGGGIFTSTTNASLRNCLIAGNTSDLSGSFISQGHNLVGSANGSSGIVGGVNGDLVGLNAMLAPLANYGGPTRTFALQPGSPAIDAGDDSVTNTLATDQRGPGFSRRSLQHVDIGAVEHQSGSSAPSITSLNTGSVTIDPVTHLGNLTVSASVSPHMGEAFPTTVWVQYGVSASYGASNAPLTLGTGFNYIPVYRPSTLAPGFAWHYRWVATNLYGTTVSPDQTVNIGTLGGGISGVVGDANGDGIVSQAELDAVYANYVTNSPWLYLTNVAGLGGTNVIFSLSNSVLGAYSIQYSTNLVDWYYLGAATPRYLFTDTNAPAAPKRYYRLSYP